MIDALAFLGIVVGVAAPLCGHQGQPFPLRLRRGAWRRLSAPLRRSDDSSVATPPDRAADGRSARPVPSWTHTEPYTDYEEAA